MENSTERDSHRAYTYHCFVERKKRNGESTSITKPSTESDQAKRNWA
jgi:hypothetical protein